MKMIAGVALATVMGVCGCSSAFGAEYFSVSASGTEYRFQDNGDFQYYSIAQAEINFDTKSGVAYFTVNFDQQCFGDCAFPNSSYTISDSGYVAGSGDAGIYSFPNYYLIGADFKSDYINFSGEEYLKPYIDAKFNFYDSRLGVSVNTELTADNGSANLDVGTVPLPASAPMFGAALLGLGALGYGMRRRGQAQAA